MYLIIVGAGVVGERLAVISANEGHEVAVIEPDEERAERVAQACDALVLRSSIIEANVLEEAGAARADALIATTGDDAQNLMAIVLARDAEIGSLVSVVNDVSHKKLFQRLDAKILLEPEELVARHLLKIANKEHEA